MVYLLALAFCWPMSVATASVVATTNDRDDRPVKGDDTLSCIGGGDLPYQSL